MSRENVEAFERGVAAFNDGDLEAFLEMFDPAAEWRPLTEESFGGGQTAYRGHDEIRRFLGEVGEALAEVRVETDETRDLGERIVVTGRLRGRGRASGVEAVTPIAWLVEFEAGKVVRMTDYLDPKGAIEAAER